MRLGDPIPQQLNPHEMRIYERAEKKESKMFQRRRRRKISLNEKSKVDTKISIPAHRCQLTCIPKS